VYVSSASVFDGRKNGFYTEGDKPCPLMKYGRTKYDGEILAAACCQQTFVVRTGWMMGGGRKKDRKFINKILQQIENGASEIFAADDLWGTPTCTNDFAMGLLALIDTCRYGIYHMVCEGAGNRYDVAREILKICRRSDISLTPVLSAFFNEEYFARRPRSEMLANKRLLKTGCHDMRHWSVALREYIENHFADCIIDPDKPFFLHSDQACNSINEKRRKTRQQVNLDLTCTLHNGHEIKTCPGELLDISESGLCLATHQRMPLQSIVTVNVPTSESWKTAAMVRWSENVGSRCLTGLKYLEHPMAFGRQYAQSSRSA
jgi:hypothetical protein